MESKFTPEEIEAALRGATGLCVTFEGVRLRPYLCAAGVPTIGVGATRYLDGRRVTLMDAPVTRDVAMVMLRHSLRWSYLPAVLKLCPGVGTVGQLAALLDFTFNLGSGSLKASTLRRKVNAGDWAGARLELAKWTRGGGKVLPGLVRRRTAEANLL